MSNINLNLFNNSKSILINQNKSFDLIIDDVHTEIEDIKSCFDDNVYKINSIEEKKEANFKDLSQSYNDFEEKDGILETRQKLADIEADKLGDEKTKYEQNILVVKNLLRKSKQIIESIETKIETPDEEELTDDDLKNQLMKLSEEIKTMLDDYPTYIDFNFVEEFIKNKYEIKGIDFSHLTKLLKNK